VLSVVEAHFFRELTYVDLPASRHRLWTRRRFTAWPVPNLYHLATLTRGWKRTLPAAVAPLVSDGPIILVCVLVLSQVPAWLQRFLYIAGGLFILYLAYGTYKSWKNFDSQTSQPKSTGGQSVLKAALMNALSPNPYIFWTLVTGPILLKGWRENASQRDWVSGGFLSHHDWQPRGDYPCLWTCLTGWTKGESHIIGSFRACPVLFWTVSIVAGRDGSIISARN